ncbi:MAG: peptidoglycan editing factor PgeF [Firmicutes bacterium HGW-Firmicutes-12]|nr:MAG: peptidoglycan editing factor PgeF [Firmicutes bacterium HGW-Firmicutes-12]
MKRAFLPCEKNELLYYTISAFDTTDLVINAFSSRKGGKSKKSFESLNLSVLTADNLEYVLENRRRLCQALGIDSHTLVGACQVHGDNIYLVKGSDRGAGALTSKTAIADTDALITNEREIPLILFYADCVPVFFLDPVKKAVGLAHAGWKGTVAKIAAKTVQALGENYGSNPKDILVAIGPSIGPCHYQVDRPVIDEVKRAYPKEWEELLTTSDIDGYAQLNLWEANLRQICQTGVPQENITVAGMCTYCCQENFFSHRRGMAGRQAAIIMLK